MGLNSISEYSAAVGKGYRGNKYKIILNLPAGVDGDSRVFSLLVRSANVPAKESGVISLNYKGKVVKAVGDDAEISPWSVEAQLEDSTTALTAKKIADSWRKLASESKDPSTYKSTATIELVSADAKQTTLLSYKLDGIWIANSGELSLSDDTTDEIATLSLEFQLDDITPISK